MSRPSSAKVIALIALLAVCLAPGRAVADNDLRISNLSVFLNDYDVTVQGVLLGAVPSSLTESLQSGVPVHVRFVVELRQQGFRDKLLQTRIVERQLTYNPATKEYKVVSLSGEDREPFMSKQLRDAQRVLSEARSVKLMPASSLDLDDVIYVRVRAESALNGENTFVARMAGTAEQTILQSDFRTIRRIQ